MYDFGLLWTLRLSWILEMGGIQDGLTVGMHASTPFENIIPFIRSTYIPHHATERHNISQLGCPNDLANHSDHLKDKACLLQYEVIIHDLDDLGWYKTLFYRR